MGKVAILAAGVACVIGVAAAQAGTAYVACGLHRGFTVYANGVTCPTAKKIVRRIDEMRYRAPKVTIRGIAGYVCVAAYAKKTKRMNAGSCLKAGTALTGFGWTRDGAIVPLPPGADAGGVGG